MQTEQTSGMLSLEKYGYLPDKGGFEAFMYTDRFYGDFRVFIPKYLSRENFKKSAISREGGYEFLDSSLEDVDYLSVRVGPGYIPTNEDMLFEKRYANRKRFFIDINPVDI